MLFPISPLALASTIANLAPNFLARRTDGHFPVNRLLLRLETRLTVEPHVFPSRGLGLLVLLPSRLPQDAVYHLGVGFQCRLSLGMFSRHFPIRDFCALDSHDGGKHKCVLVKE